jgi:hypothetical protein
MADKFSYQIGGLPLADLFSSYESGTFLEFKNTRYHVREDFGGLASGTRKFFAEQVGQNGWTIGETNMMIGGQLEKGHWFSIAKIGVKISQRRSANNKTLQDSRWYENVLQTLVKYGILRFRINGLDHLGEFRLSQLIPSIQSVGQVMQAPSGVNTASLNAGNTAPIMAAGVFDLGDRQIRLSELVNFWCEIQWDIPQRKWIGQPVGVTQDVTTGAPTATAVAPSLDGTAITGALQQNSFANLPTTGSISSELLVIPDNTIVELQLIGEELRAQG